MSRELSSFRVLTFDCYGTLIDWESGIWDAGQPLLQASERNDITRSLWLRAFAEAESAQQVATPELRYPELLAQTHRAMAGHFGIASTVALDQAFGASVAHWPAFPDTADALRILKSSYRLVILSNVHRDGFAASNRKLGVPFDAVYTAEDIGTYKPDPANFDYMLARLERDFGLQKHDILHTAQSLHHDIVQAVDLGLATAWIDRQRLSEGGDWGATAKTGSLPETDFTFFTLAEMSDAVAAGRIADR